MKNAIAYRTRNWLTTVLALLVSFTFVTTWLPLLRCLMDGTSYRWGTGYFGMSLSSEGMSIDYLALVVWVVLYMALFASFYWVKKRIIFYLLLGWWWLHSFGSLLYDIWKNGDSMFHGDTLNIHVSVSKIVIPLSILTLVLALVLVLKDRKIQDVHIPWSRKNTRLAWIILGPLALQAILFSTGEPHGITDQIGVVIALVQCFAIPFIFSPSKA